MELTQDDVRNIIADGFARGDAARAAGGIPLVEVVDGTAAVPNGWWFDEMTYYYLPPNFHFGEATKN